MNCCYECKNRVLGCHTSCKEYIEQRKKHEEIRNARHKEHMIADIILGKRGK